jgi:hypothetical protein
MRTTAKPNRQPSRDPVAVAMLCPPRRSEGQSAAGHELNPHELAHVVQHRRGQDRAAFSNEPVSTSAFEAEAERAATATPHGSAMPALSTAPPGAQSRLSMRDVGRGEASRFARLGELVIRLNAMSRRLNFAVVDGELTCTAMPGGAMNNIDQQMKGFIDSPKLTSLRLVNSQGLSRDADGDYVDRVAIDDWSSDYVDIDDLLASTDFGLQSALVHLRVECMATANYALRMGSTGMDSTRREVQPELDRNHARGIDADVALVRDFFGDLTIRHVPGAKGGSIQHVDTNSRRDRIHTRMQVRRQVATLWLSAVLHADGRVPTAEASRDMIEDERTASQVRRERLNGATEYRGGGRSVPVP